ncbi:MAG: hypothetical protein ACJ74U_10390 [Jatrophihabitantaceae bacterium]
MAGSDITRCGYDGNLTVTASWDVTPGPPMYTVTVFDGGSPLVSDVLFGGSGEVSLKEPLDPNDLQYTVAAAPGQGSGHGAYGTALSVIAGRLSDLTATLRGEIALEVSWTLPNPSVNGARLRVADAQGHGYGSGWIQGSAGTLTLDRPLDPAGSYTLYGAAAFEQSTGPEIAVPLVVEIVPLAALRYDRTGPNLALKPSLAVKPSLALKLSAAPPSGVRPGALLFADDDPPVSYLGDAGSSDLTVTLDAPLDPAVRYTVRPFLLAGTVRGPLGPTVEVLVSAPPVTGVCWAGQQLVVRWQPLAAPPAPTGGLLAFSGPGAHPAPTPAFEATSWSGVPNPPFVPGQSSAYTVTAANTRGVATGPMGEGLAVIVDTDALLTASYDGAVVRASWPTAARPGATGARLLVLDGDSVVASVDAGPTSGGAAVAVTLEVGPAHTAALQWTGDRTTGPIGPRTTLLLAAPTLTQSIAGDAELTLRWDPPAGHGPAVTGYQAILSAPGMAPVAQAATSGTAFAAPVLSMPPLGLVARVVALAAGGVTGPPSAPLRVVGGVAQVRSAQVEAGGLLVSWDAVPEAADYTLLLGIDDHLSRQVIAGTSAILDLAPLRGHQVAVAVAPGAGLAVGRSGSSVPVPLVGPTLGAPTVEGSTLTVPVTGPDDTGATIDRYEVVLLRDGQPASDRLVVAGTSSTLTLPVDPSFDPTASWSVAVWAGAGRALGPAARAAALLAAPVVESIVAASTEIGTDLTITVGHGALPAAGLDLIAAVLHGQDAPLTKPVGPDGSCTISVPRGSGSYAVVARAVRTGATGPWSAPVAALMTAPAIIAARCEAERLFASWSGDPTAEYAVEISGSDGSVFSQLVRGPGATPALESGDGIARTLTVREVAGRVTGPVGSQALLATPVLVTSVLTDPGTGLPTVSWPAVTSPPGASYQVQLLRDGQPDGAPVAASTTSLTLGAPLVPGARQAVAVRALATGAGGAALVGPFGPPLALPVGLPVVESVDYDGATALVRWRGAEGATGYAVDVLVDGASDRAGHAQVGAGERAARVTVTPTPDKAKTWTVVVRALAATSSGPRALAPLVTPGLVPALDAVAGVSLPRLFRASTLAAAPGQLTAFLPELGIAAASIPANPPAGAPFVIAKNTDNATSGAFPYTLTIGGAALSFAAADRATVRAGYDALLKDAEALTPAITPRGVALLRDVIARLLPQTFTETLYYAYGLANPGSAVDLRPGMILRVGAPPFQAIPSTKPPTYAQGYAASATTDFEIDDYVQGTAWLAGFDAFLSWLVANENLIVRDPAHSADWSVVSGAADAADLYYPGLRRPFYRLFFPQYLQGVTDPAVSSLTQQFTLLGADTYTAISTAVPGALPPNVRPAVFRGRSVLRVCVKVQVDGTDQVVPVGTTAGNVLDRLARRAPGTPPALRGVTLERALGAAVLNPDAYDAGASQPVWLGWRGAGFAPGADVLSLPLLPGDRLRTGADR